MRLQSTASLLLTILSTNVRRRRFAVIILAVFMVIILIVLLVQKSNYETLSASGILEFTKKEIRLPKGIFIHPKKTCAKPCIKNTVITVVSRTSHTDRRQTIRQTWGHPEAQRKYNFCLFFVLGIEDNIDIRKETSSENEDIIQVEVSENYFSLTEKVVETFRWIMNFCQEPRYFFKIDDDVYFDLEFLNELHQDESYLPDNILLGTCKRSTPVYRNTYKYHTTLEEYPFKTYPPYCEGPGYIMTMNTARKIYHEMLVTKTFKYEDVYVGMVAYKLGIQVKNVDNFIYALDKWDGHMQMFYIRCSRISHRLTSNNIQHLWDKRNKGDKEHRHCSLWGKLTYMLKYFYSFIIDQMDDFRIST